MAFLDADLQAILDDPIFRTSAQVSGPGGTPTGVLYGAYNNISNVVDVDGEHTVSGQMVTFTYRTTQASELGLGSMEPRVNDGTALLSGRWILEIDGQKYIILRKDPDIANGVTTLVLGAYEDGA